VTPSDLAALRAQLTPEEGRRSRPYKDSRGYLTVGIGRNIDAVPFSDDEIDLMFANDVARAEAGLIAHLQWYAALDPVRKRVLIDLAFNLGTAGLLAFHQTLSAIAAGDYTAAAADLQDSIWSKEVGERAVKLEQMLRTGLDA
jgi:lysozyme